MSPLPRHLVVLDNEAVQALRSRTHPKHEEVAKYLRVAVGRRRPVVRSWTVVPTAVRAEAGWDRTDSGWAFVNQLEIVDVPLHGTHADAAAAIRRRVDRAVSVVDAHVGAVVQAADAERITVITSDPKDMAAVAEQTPVVIVAI